jgi:hypothetical protein
MKGQNFQNSQNPQDHPPNSTNQQTTITRASMSYSTPLRVDPSKKTGNQTLKSQIEK